MTVLIDSEDLDDVERFVNANYHEVRLAPTANTSARVRVDRAELGELTLDDFSYGIDFQFESFPTDGVVVCMVRAGAVVRGTDAKQADVFGPGDVLAVGAHDSGFFTGHAHGLQCDAIALDAHLLGTVAAAPGGGDVIRLTAARPVSPIATAHLIRAIQHVKHSVMADPLAARSPLIIGNVRRYLAAGVLAAFPTTAHLETTATDRNDSTPTLLRRAIAFIEDNAERDISMVDIANAVYVTPRALQYMFRKHCHCTPTEYLRRARLSHAHADLVAGDRSMVRVAEVAARWGFSHSGRFAVYYREQYGESPHSTLRR
ncbi:helix-turn-helix transcriptional regulator [Mycobacterium kyogaense]|uniref:helix-turn-helix transcriptional regulator n=1 Tax=Mycobacterium kyogaense TaxID=2212479 RepID=UPI000DACCAE6|nr:helix-turn-helix transcriptional regulator [Mycobacterium kyogaense]